MITAKKADLRGESVLKLNELDPETPNEAENNPLESNAIDILDPNSQIGAKLRSFYTAVQEEAIPDRFLDLLEKLDHVEMMASQKKAAE